MKNSKEKWKSIKKPKQQEKKHKGLTFKILTRIKKKNPKQYKKIIFNMLFLRKMRKEYGSLWCVYCGKHVEICPMGQSKPVSILATADHFLPASQHPDLEFEESNLRVCCAKCNSKKADKLWKENFPYNKNQ